MNQTLKPLVACAANEGNLRTRIEAAAEQIGTDFFSSSDLDKTFRACDRRRTSCVVVDYENTRRQVEQLPKQTYKSRVLLVAIPHGDIDAAFQSASAGAIGVLEKPIKNDDLLFCIKNALAVGLHVKKTYEEKDRYSNQNFGDLTEREKSVLGLLMSGEPNKRVASMLDIGLRTVEGDRAQLMRKLGVPSFVELIKLVTHLENDIASTRQVFFKNAIVNKRR